MSGEKFTKGEWVVTNGHAPTIAVLVKDKDGFLVNRFFAQFQSCRQPHEAQNDELLANATLAVAAPDLYAALIGLIEECNAFAKVIPPYASSEALAAAKSAIRKALGDA